MLALLAACSLGGLVLMNVAPAIAQGQTTVGTTNIAKLEFQQTDVRQALRELFKHVGVSYTIDPNVQGTVTLSLQNVPFEVALQNLTRQVDSTYRIEGGVYTIVPRDYQPRPEQGTYILNPPPKTEGGHAAMVVDGNSLFVMHDGVVDKIDKRTMKVVGTAVLSQGR